MLSNLETKDVKVSTHPMCTWVGQTCGACGFTLPDRIDPSSRPVYRACPGQAIGETIMVQAAVDYRTIGDFPNGPGSVMEGWFESWGVSPCQRCTMTAHWMNVMGVDECEKQLNEVVSRILANAKVNTSLKRAFVAYFPDVILRTSIKRLVRSAITKSKRLELRAENSV